MTDKSTSDTHAYGNTDLQNSTDTATSQEDGIGDSTEKNTQASGEPNAGLEPAPDPSIENDLWSGVRSWFGPSKSTPLRTVLEEALGQDENEGNFTQQERAMLRNILRFGGLRVEDVMVPRADIRAIEDNATLSDLVEVFDNAGHSRIPVYHDTLDDPRGMVHVKDFMHWITTTAQRGSPDQMQKGQSTLRLVSSEDLSLQLGAVTLDLTVGEAEILREVLYVPPSMSVVDLLLRMQSTRIHMALVVDEYGGTDGLVSIEDLVEEIVGEIEDEHDIANGPLISVHSQLGLIAAARTPIEDLENYLGVSLITETQDGDVDTLGGLVFSLAGRVPVKGELVRHPAGLEFEVLEADPRRIKRLRIHVGAAKAQSSDEDET